jgi:hypothetical protein
MAQFLSCFSFVTVLAVSGLTYAQEVDDEALEEIVITYNRHCQ